MLQYNIMILSDLAFQPQHDHTRCVKQAIGEAVELCKHRKQRLTPIRELVLKLIWKSHKPLGAYELLPAIAKAGFNSAPPTVYRALDFLLEQGLIHRIASLNAFIGCSHPEHRCSNSFFICTQCHSAVEIESATIDTAIQASASELGFKIATQTLEVAGVCPTCQTETPES